MTATVSLDTTGSKLRDNYLQLWDLSAVGVLTAKRLMGRRVRAASTSSLSDETGDKLLRACRTTLGDDLRSLTYFSKEEFDHLYLRDNLERGTDTSAFVENERERFSSHRTYEWSELGEYEYTLRVFNEGYVVRVIAAREQYRGLGDSTVEHRPADDTVVVTDGGVRTESTTQNTDVEARISGPWTEPADQGGATYDRCEDCGRESLRCGDRERSEFHAEECALR